MPYADKRKLREYQCRWMKARRQLWIYEHGPCQKCGSLKELQVDHRDRTQKVTHRVWSWAEVRRLEELSKCWVLCRLCHREKTIGELSKPLEHGTRTGYTKGCRCRKCTDAAVQAVRRWREKHSRVI